VSPLLIAPLLLPLLGASLTLVLWRWPRLQAGVGIGAAALLLPTAAALLRDVQQAGTIAGQVGGWQAPVGITLAADGLSALMLLLTAVIGTAVAVYGAGEAPLRRGRHMFFPLLHVLLLGVSGAFLTGDLFNLYVWFEVLLVGSFGLLILGGRRDDLEGAVKALVLNLLGSLLFLLAAGAVYGLAGTLNLADLHSRLAEVYAVRPGAVTVVALLLAVAFSLKAALFPLYFWLPASYHVPSAGICALFAALLTKVGVYSLLRVLTLPLAAVPDVYPVVLVATTVTMLSGVLGAVAQMEMNRILAWHSISQVGYIVVGVGLLAVPQPEVQRAGLVAAVFFVIHHGLVKPALFLIAGLVRRDLGTTRLGPAGGLYAARPVLAMLFLLAALSLAGIPPLSGFWAKLAVLRASALAAQWWVLGVALAAGLLTLLSMLKIWIEVFWKPAPAPVADAAIMDTTDPAAAAAVSAVPRASDPGRADGAVTPASPAAMWASTAALVLLVTLLGVAPGPLLDLADGAAAALLRPDLYVQAVSP
jgi:multicomponent Na+:H+ antiporter subunit D